MKIPGLRFEPDTELPWRETRLVGVSWLPLYVEEEPRREGRERGGGAVLIRMEPGSGYAPHRHLGTEDVLVLQGGYRDEHGEYRSGEHVHYAGGSVHAPRALGDPDRPIDATNPACVLFAVAPEGIEILPDAPGVSPGPGEVQR